MFDKPTPATCAPARHSELQRRILVCVDSDSCQIQATRHQLQANNAPPKQQPPTLLGRFYPPLTELYLCWKRTAYCIILVHLLFHHFLKVMSSSQLRTERYTGRCYSLLCTTRNEEPDLYFSVMGIFESAKTYKSGRNHQMKWPDVSA